MTMGAATVIYALFLVYAVLRLLKAGGQGEEDWLLMGRRLTLPAFVATTVSSWYGGILGVSEYSYSYGLSNWLVFGVPYYLYALIFAFFLARRARRSPALTIPDQLRRRWGPAVSYAGAAVLFVMTAPAAYVLALGMLLADITGWSLAACVVGGTVLSLGYVWRGGLGGVVFTDKVQFVLMYLGFAILVPAAVLKLGGPGWLVAHLPAEHLQPLGGQPVQSVAVWYVLAASTLVEPAFYQRCFAARDENTARRGLLISVGFWLIFDLLTTTTGLYARAALPGLEASATGASGAFPALAQLLLPGPLLGLFMVGLLATVMSTIDSYGFLAAVTLGRDILWRWQGSHGDSNRWSRLGLVVTGVLSAALALWRGSVVGLWHDLGSVGTPVLLLPLAVSFTGVQLRHGWVLAAMILGGGTSLAWLLPQALGGTYPLGIEPIFPGLLVSAVCMLLGAVGRRAISEQAPTGDPSA